MHLRVRAVVRTDDPIAAERGAFECPVIIYQRTDVSLRQGARRTAQRQFRTVAQIAVIHPAIVLAADYGWVS